MEKPKTIGVNNGFLTKDGRLLLQLRTTESWMGKLLKKSYKGQWELNDGGFEVENIEEELTLPFLKEKAIENARKKLGINVTIPEDPHMYLTVYENKDKGILDWAIMFPIPPKYWELPKKLLRNIMLVDVDGLNDLANRSEGKGSLVSGWGKRQHRMGLGALYCSLHAFTSHDAFKDLYRIKPDFNFTGSEYFDDAGSAIINLRKELGLE